MKKKIIRIITRLNIGGPTLNVVNLCVGLAEEYETLLVSGQIEPHESDMSYYAKKYNIPIYYLKHMSRELRFPADFIALWELYLLFRREKPDIVHTHTAKAGTLGRIAAFLAGVPKIYHTFHGNIFKGYFSNAKTKLFIKIEKVLASITTNIISISEKQKQELVDLSIARPEKISVIKLGFDFSNVLSTKEYLGTFRQKFQIPSDAYIIAIIGRITAIKNHALFLDISEKLLNKQNKVPIRKLFFVIVGDGDMKQEIQAEIEKRKLSENIIITGFLNDMKAVYADVDMVVLTSHNEGTPVALIEAMINKKVVLSTNVGGISDFVENNINGFYFNTPNADLFVEKITEIIDNRRESNFIGEKAKQSVHDMFSMDRLVNDIMKLYQDEKNI